MHSAHTDYWKHAPQPDAMGAQFRTLREHYGLSIAQVAARLHIRAPYLKAIEEGDLSALPGKVYSQGYIISYAEFLGLDPQEALQQYEGLGQPANKPAFKVTDPTRQRGIPAWRLVVAGLLGLALIYVLLGQLMQPNLTPIDSRIAPVPKALQQRAKQVWVLSDANRQCLNPTLDFSATPCYYVSTDKAPLRSIMELKSP